MKKEVHKVSVVKCKTYKQKYVDRAVARSLDLAGIKLPENKTVLIKPNVVGFFKKNQIAITTHPSVIEAVCKLLRKKNCRIYIGDSSFTDAARAFRASGIEKIAKKYGKLIIFEQDKLVRIKNNKDKVLKSFYVSKTLKQADLVINVPKLKTHILTKFTGGIKNMYGCIPGGMKQKLHGKAPNEKALSRMLVDIYQNIKPEVNIMDGIIGMEGKGPSSGEPIKSGYILASRNTISLDVVASKLIGYKPRKIFAIKEAVKRKLGNFKFKLVGMKNLPNLNFKKPFVEEKLSRRLLHMFKQRAIVVDEKKCVQCGLCARKCPMHAISMNPYPSIDKKKCIRCYCCMEICPNHALSLKKD